MLKRFNTASTSQKTETVTFSMTEGEQNTARAIQQFTTLSFNVTACK
jgi:hypothetical protein